MFHFKFCSILINYIEIYLWYAVATFAVFSIYIARYHVHFYMLIFIKCLQPTNAFKPLM